MIHCMLLLAAYTLSKMHDFGRQIDIPKRPVTNRGVHRLIQTYEIIRQPRTPCQLLQNSGKKPVEE
jgi:hypothetical protein